MARNRAPARSPERDRRRERVDAARAPPAAAEARASAARSARSAPGCGRGRCRRSVSAGITVQPTPRASAVVASNASAARRRCASARSCASADSLLLSALIELNASTRRTPAIGLRANQAANASSGPRLIRQSARGGRDPTSPYRSPWVQVTPAAAAVDGLRLGAWMRSPRASSCGNRNPPTAPVAPKMIKVDNVATVRVGGRLAAVPLSARLRLRAGDPASRGSD